VDLVGHLRRQALACERFGSPLYSALAGMLADDVEAGGPTADVLRPWTGHAPADLDAAAPGIRLLAGLHHLVLARQAPELALGYPSVGGQAAPADLDAAVLRHAVAAHADELRAFVARAPQTNEVGRAAPLLGGLRRVATRTGGLPVRMAEIGASAGLNLRVDHLPVGLGRLVDSPLPDADQPVRIVERIGADLHPVDPTTTQGRLLLTSYVWADDLVRMARLRAALTVAAQVPAPVVQESAGTLLGRLALAPGTATVLWHSVLWQYLDGSERTQVGAGIDRLATAASTAAPFAHLRFEPEPDGAGGTRFVVRLTCWPGGDETILGHAPPHGVPVVWDGDHG